MKKTLFLSLAVLMTAMAFAKPVDPDRAVQVARNYVAQYVKGADRYTVEVVYAHSMPKSQQPAMYVVNVGNTFVLVAADDVAHPVLGYSLSRPWPVQSEELRMKREESSDAVIKLPSHVTGFLDDLARQIAAGVEAGISPDEETAAEWHQLLTVNSQLSTTNLPDSVGPLLTTTWDQGQYYNTLCPADANGPDGHVYIGCVATAMAQIINYWGYPVQGRGTHSYYHNIYGTLSVDYNTATYDYANMPAALSSTSTSAEVSAVATLMYHCGVAANMGYGPYESSAYDQDARAGLINFFRISPDASYAEKAYFSNADWQNLLRENIASSQPVMYSGHGTGGHTFVCDGYKADDYFHFNFGWSGYADGWYVTSAINPAGSDYSSDQTAIVGIVPDSTGNIILGQMDGTSTFTVNEPLEFYHIMGHNAYEGTSYSNSCNNNVLFTSADPTKQLVFDIISFENQNITVYDGNGGSLLKSLHVGSDNDLSPVVSTNHALKVAYQGVFYYTGFHLNISQDNGCRMVSNIITSVDTTTIHLSWTENGTSTQWQIEYGLEGFSMGEGTSLSVNDTAITINGLLKFRKYDFYIRPQCGESWFGPIKITTRSQYWIDMVHTQPEGYVVGELDNEIACYPITISSTEGLAWWAKQVFDGLINVYTPVTIVADIDLGGYLWKPVSEYYGKFNGDGHIISNMTIIESGENSDNSGWGFFRFYRGPHDNKRATISNLFFKDPYIKVDKGEMPYSEGIVTYYFAGTGVLAGRALYVSVFNCGVINGSIIQLFSQPLFSDGMLVGMMENTDIKNCYSEGNITSVSNYVSGFVGNSMTNDNSINNCYSSVLINSFTGKKGSICANVRGGELHHCYGVNDNISLVGFNQAPSGSSMTDTSRFSRETLILEDSIFWDGVGYSDLLTVLNKRVEFENDSNWRIWKADSTGLNNGFPLLGDRFLTTCPNVNNIVAVNVVKNSDYAVRVAWEDDIQTNSWMVKYWEKDSLERTATYVITDTNVVEISDLIVGRVYNICVRRDCDDNHHSGWGSPVQIMFDKPYWTDIVTSQPEGYLEDEEGNVTITSAEGLAWLSCLINGLHGQNKKRYIGKTVKLMTDIDLSQYKWLPMGFNTIDFFVGSFDGNHHTISNMYIREQGDYVGLFGFIHQINYHVSKKIHDLTLLNCTVIGEKYVGGFFGGYGSNNEIDSMVMFDNCHVRNINIQGEKYVGALAGFLAQAGHRKIINCSTTGEIYGNEYVGGLIGDIGGGTNDLFANCYSLCNIHVTTDLTNVGGLIGWAKDCNIQNSYATSSVVNVGWPVDKIVGFLCSHVTCKNIYGLQNDGHNPLTGGQYDPSTNVISDTSAFSTNGLLDNAVNIGGVECTNLLSALNAWVDENDSLGIYRHWAADSTGENGGFPVFAAIPCITATGSDSIVVCDSYTWRGATYTVSTELKDTLSTMDGCDSIVTHYLTVNHPAHTATNETACESYTWTAGNGTTYTTSGDYTYSHQDANGCTQVDTLHLNINFNSTGDTSAVACDNFTWYSTTYTTSATPTHVFTNAAGCDSTVTLNLTINQSTTGSETATACESYLWSGQWLVVSGQYFDTNTNAVGCDSIVTLNLTINNPVHTATTEEACDSYTWQEATITVSGDYTYPHDDANGCTQVDTLHLTINYSNTGDTTAVACDNFTWYGTTYTASATPTHVFSNAAGCDSTVTLNLTINHSTTSSETATACESYLWSGQWLVVSGQYFDTNTNAAGCDSIVTLNLTINNPVNTATTETACDSYTWQGTDYTASGDYIYSHLDANGCTQVDTLHLTINYSNTGDTTAVACDNFTWYGTTYTASATPTHVFSNAAGCDSTVTLNLTINHSTTSSETATACESYLWSGQWLVVSGQYFDTNTNAAGCDSIVTLNLTINNPVHTAITEAACETYTWNGITYTTSGDYTYSHPDANGCTQVDTLHLTINNPVNTAITETACDSYTWQGTDYTTSGDYTCSHLEANGCTQVDTLHLTINNPVNTATTETACDSYTWQEATITVSGDYTYPHDDANGCTQVDTLHLTIYYSVETTVIDTAEESYTWNGTTYTESGTYQWLGQTAEGCDSTVTLNLTVTHTEGIDDVNNGTIISISVLDGHIFIGEVGNLRPEVRVYDVMGRQYPTFTSHVSPFTLPDGVYLVKVGNYPARRVVVIR